MTARPLSRRRRILFRLLCLLLPLALLGALEGVLRLTGFGGYPEFFRELPLADGTTLVVSDKAGSSRYFFANRDRPGTNDEFALKMPKPAGTTRILLCGASAIKGFPQPRAFTAGAFLRDLLQHFWPERQVEVINLGTTAVASFAVLDIVRDAISYDPDLVILYTGNNEFFGAYGVASVNKGLASPSLIAGQYRLRSLGITQAMQRIFGKSADLEGRTLMEAMIDQLHISPESELRDGAARLLYAHVSEIARLCKQHGVPLLVCLPAANDQGLMPLGEARLSHLAEGRRKAVVARVSSAESQLDDDPAAARELLELALGEAPTHARAHFLAGRAADALGDAAAAQEHYQAAVDHDPMPWRPPAKSVNAIRSAAREQDVPICDVSAVLRGDASGIGWDLMDDHVHFSLQGQHRLARALAASLTSFPESIRVDPEQLAQAPDLATQGQRLGHNPYDAYGVAVQMRTIFSIPFMRKSNPGAHRRWSDLVEEAEAAMAPDVLDAARQWQQKQTHAGGMRPMSGMVGRVMMRRQRFDEARRLFTAAQGSVPEYSAWHMEYVYFALVCSESLRQVGRLSSEEQRQARREIERGAVLLEYGKSASGMAQRHMGRLHQLLNEYAEAVPYLRAARARLSGLERVAADKALVLSYVKTEQAASARDLAREGVEQSGKFRQHYQQMLDSIPDS